MKNVYLKGLQDTYYSNGAEGMTGYFETCKIEGTVDFICGSGSILFNECDLYVADRSQSKTSANVITSLLPPMHLKRIRFLWLYHRWHRQPERQV